MSVQSIDRAFAILRTVAAAPSGIGITELAQRTDLHKSTVSRLVAALEAQGAVARVPATSGVCLGAGLLALLAASQAPAALTPERLAYIARPHLEALARQVGETVGLCVPDGDRVLYLDQVDSAHALQVRNWTGQRHPQHVTSSGKLFLALGDEAARRQYLAGPHDAYTAHSVVAASALADRLEETRRQGYDWSFEEFELGLVAMSGPIFGPSGSSGSGSRGGQIIASVYVSGPIYRFPAPGSRDQVTAAVLATCRTISNQLQGLPYRQANAPQAIIETGLG